MNPSSATPRRRLSARIGSVAANAFSTSASHRSWKLGTAFRSPVTTLSPPLRGLGSRPAPSLPRRRVFAYPFDSGSSARFGFEAETGRILSPEPVVRADLRRSCDDFRSPLPFRSLNPPDRPLRVFQPARRATRSIGFITTSSPRPTLDSFLLLATLLFRLALRIKTRNPPSSFPGIFEDLVRTQITTTHDSRVIRDVRA